MKTKYKRATIYFDTQLHRALKMKAAQSERTISEIVNVAVSRTLHEDLEDLLVFEERKGESETGLEQVLKELKASGKI